MITANEQQQRGGGEPAGGEEDDHENGGVVVGDVDFIPGNRSLGDGDDDENDNIDGPHNGNGNGNGNGLFVQNKEMMMGIADAYLTRPRFLYATTFVWMSIVGGRFLAPFLEHAANMSSSTGRIGTCLALQQASIAIGSAWAGSWADAWERQCPHQGRVKLVGVGVALGTLAFLGHGLERAWNATTAVVVEYGFGGRVAVAPAPDWMSSFAYHLGLQILFGASVAMVFPVLDGLTVDYFHQKQQIQQQQLQQQQEDQLQRSQNQRHGVDNSHHDEPEELPQEQQEDSKSYGKERLHGPIWWGVTNLLLSPLLDRYGFAICYPMAAVAAVVVGISIFVYIKHGTRANLNIHVSAGLESVDDNNDDGHQPRNDNDHGSLLLLLESSSYSPLPIEDSMRHQNDPEDNGALVVASSFEDEQPQKGSETSVTDSATWTTCMSSLPSSVVSGLGRGERPSWPPEEQHSNSLPGASSSGAASFGCSEKRVLLSQSLSSSSSSCSSLQENDSVFLRNPATLLEQEDEESPELRVGHADADAVNGENGNGTTTTSSCDGGVGCGMIWATAQQLLFSSALALAFCFCLICIASGQAVVDNLVFLFFESSLGRSWTIMGVTVVVKIAAEVPVFYFGPQLLRQFGPGGVLLVGCVCYFTRAVVYTLLPNNKAAGMTSYLILALEPLHGITYGAVQVAAVEFAAQQQQQQAMLSSSKSEQGASASTDNNAPGGRPPAPQALNGDIQNNNKNNISNNEALAQGLVNFIRECGSVMGVYMGGWVASHLGPRAMFRLSALWVLTGTGVLGFVMMMSGTFLFLKRFGSPPPPPQQEQAHPHPEPQLSDTAEHGDFEQEQAPFFGRRRASFQPLTTSTDPCVGVHEGPTLEKEMEDNEGVVFA
ncbi:hypothetical protein ACA910_018641 [Epithemia clementina (nom. ined.)]